MKGWPEKQDLMGDQKEVVKDAGHQVRRTVTRDGAAVWEAKKL